jgi:hypothetical protein
VQASTSSDAEAEAADRDTATAMARWIDIAVAAVMPLPTVDGGPRARECAQLSLLTGFVQELVQSHDKTVLRALLYHTVRWSCTLSLCDGCCRR